MHENLPGKRVLVVEDNPALAFDMDDALRDCGAYVVGPALDLTTGLELARDTTLDGAVLDIDIGGELVWPIAHELQSHSVPFVFVSGDCHHGLPEDFVGTACLAKPAQTEAIMTIVSDAMGPDSDRG